jgi:hypothetical protein
MANKIFLIAVDVKEEAQHIEDFAYRKAIAKNEDEAKQIVFQELKENYEFEDYEDFENLIYFCSEVDTTTQSQSFGFGY